MLKTRIITEIFKQADTPVALFMDNAPEWHNDRFAALPIESRERLVEHATSGIDAPVFVSGYRFELLSAKQHRLLIGTSDRRDLREKQLIRELIPSLAEGGDPWLTSASVIGPLLEWQHCAAIKHKSATADDLLGHWHNGKLMPPGHLPLASSAAAELYSGGQEQLVLLEPEKRYPDDPLFHNSEAQLCIMQRVDRASGQAAGYLCIWSDGSTSDLAPAGRLLALAADLIASHLDSDGRRPQQEMPELPDYPTDDLTELPGRTAFDATLELFEEHYLHYGQNCELAMLDINGLSTINQTRGFEQGDAVLRHFAALLRHICRPEDRVFRFGGDEFVVLMPYRQEPPPLRERLGHVEREMRKKPGLESFSASAGIASLSESNGSSDDLMLLSDRRLRQAKAAHNDNQGIDNA